MMDTRILIGTADGLYEHGIDDPIALSGTAVGALSAAADGWYAIAGGSSVLRSSDGRAWEPMTQLRGLKGNCVLPLDGGALVGTSEAHLVRVADSSAKRERAFDDVPTRGTWYTPWGGPPDVRSLTRDASGAFFANVHVGGIVRSSDGEEWKATSMDIDADVHQVLAHPTEPGLAFAVTAIGPATSPDCGETWSFDDEGLHAAYCRAVAVAGDWVLLSASAGHTGRRAALYRRAIADGPFERCRDGLPEWFADNVDTYCLDARGELAALGTASGELFVSTDAGRTWQMARTGLPPVRCVALARS